MRALRIYGVIPVVAMAVSSCDDRPPGAEDPVISETLEGVAEILTGEGGASEPPVEDPLTNPNGEGEPAIPTAEPVPDKPGFVISPYNGKWIDVTGMTVGSTAADPDFPPEEKKYFIVPEPLPLPVPETPPEPPAPDSSSEQPDEPDEPVEDDSSTV